MDAVEKAGFTLGPQERIWHTTPGNVESFERKVAKMYRIQNAGAVTNSMEMQAQVKQMWWAESVGVVPTFLQSHPLHNNVNQLRLSRQGRPERTFCQARQWLVLFLT